MPSIRIGFATDFNLLNELVGIGTTIPTARLDVVGAIRADNSAGSGGVSTITRYDGFSNSSQTLGNTVSIAETSKGNLNSISGEIIIPDGKTITVADGVSIGAGRLDSLTVLKTFDLPSGGTSGRVATSERGSTRYNEDLGQLEFYTGYEWRTVGSYDGSGRGRGVFGGGRAFTPGSIIYSIIDYVNISSTGNALNFGTLLSAINRISACGNETRGLFAGAESPSNVIQYITTASQGNSIDFGDLTEVKQASASLSSSTRGITAGGSFSNVICYVQINTLGNALDFGDLTSARRTWNGSCASSTRGIFLGGTTPGFSTSNTIEFITISSTGNAVDFGDALFTGSYNQGCSNNVRGVFFGAYNQKVLQYITIATTGNATYFGDLISQHNIAAACASSTRGLFGGGYNTTNTIEFIAISSTGNAQDFGDLTVGRGSLGAFSDSHGGLGGF